MSNNFHNEPYVTVFKRLFLKEVSADFEKLKEQKIKSKVYANML